MRESIQSFYYFSLYPTLIIRLTSETLKHTLLPTTPFSFLILLTPLSPCYCCNFIYKLPFLGWQSFAVFLYFSFLRMLTLCYLLPSSRWFIAVIYYFSPSPFIASLAFIFFLLLLLGHCSILNFIEIIHLFYLYLLSLFCNYCLKYHLLQKFIFYFVFYLASL